MQILQTQAARNFAVLGAVGIGIALLFAVDPAGASARAMHFLGTRVDVLHGQAVFIAGLAMVIALEVVWTGYAESSLARLLRPSRSAWIDIACFILMQFGLYGALTYVFSFSAASVLPRFLHDHLPAGLFHLDSPWLQFFWLMLAMDFTRYWIHFFQHKLGFWWEAHAFHHCATEMNVITTTRAHPLDQAVQLIVLAIPTTLLGGSMLDFFVLNLAMAMHAGLTHSMLPWNFGWLGRWVLYSPIGHRIHHSDLPEHHDKNLGSVFVFWDRLFGTWYAGPVVNQTVGLEHNIYNRNGLLSDFVTCALRFYGAVLATLRRPFAGLHQSLFRRPR